MKIMALDIGEKRTGVAISDALGIIAQPYKTLIRKDNSELLDSIKLIIAENNVSELVIGIPYTLKGSHSKKTEEILKLKEYFAEHLSIPVNEVDERLTTKLAERTLHELGKKPSKHRDKIDQIAAMHSLQLYLDMRRNK